MSTYQENAPHIEISEDAARGGVTGHNVRYVLAFGLTGIIAAFAAIGLYFGFDRIETAIAEGFARHPWQSIRDFAPYAGIIAAGAILAGLLLGAWNALWGWDDNQSQRGMRIRVVVQFALICVVMAILYLSTMS